MVLRLLKTYYLLLNYGCCAEDPDLLGKLVCFLCVDLIFTLFSIGNVMKMFMNHVIHV